MLIRRCLALSTTAVIALGFAVVGWADEKSPPTPEQQECMRMQSHARAGCPQTVACWAVGRDMRHYSGYPVGGGAAVVGQAPCPSEGTWGWDYRGCFGTKVVDLNWWHGRHGQGGGGTYRTDGYALGHPR